VLPMDIRGLCAVQHECPWTFALFDCFVDNRSYVQSRTCNLGHSLLGSIPVQGKPLSVGLFFLYQIVQDNILSLTVKKSHFVKNVDIRSYVRSLLTCIPRLFHNQYGKPVGTWKYWPASDPVFSCAT